MDIESTVYPLSRYWYSGDLRYYYGYGNMPPQDFLQNCSSVDNPAILVLGCGDIRSCFYSLWKNFDVKGPARFSGVEFVLNDISAAVLARDILFLYLCIHLPEEEAALKKWLCGMWAIWYCHELYPEHSKLLNESLHALCKYSNDWSNDSNSLYPLVKFSSSATLSKLKKIWKMWLHRKVKVASVKAMNSSRKAFISRYDNSVQLDAGASAFIARSTKIPYEQSKKSDQQRSEALSYVEKGSVYAEVVLGLNVPTTERTIVNITLFEREDGTYTLHCCSLPFRCYFHTVEFKNELGGLVDKLIVPDESFKMLPLLANSVQQFSVWVQSTHRVLKSGHNVSFTFNCSHALTFCYELENEKQLGFPKFDLIYTSTLMDSLSPPNLIMSTIPLLKDNGLLFTFTNDKHQFGTLDRCITTAFGFDCKFLPIFLGIRCINHEGDGYASPVTVQPCPLTVKGNDIFQEVMLVWEKLMPDTIPLIGQIPDAVCRALLSSVQSFVYPLIITPKSPMMINNSCVETAIKFFQVLMSNVCAEFSPHFWQPLSDALQGSIKPYLQCMQTQLILHGIHMHLTVSEESCPICSKVPISSFLGLFSAKWAVKLCAMPSFMAIVHKEDLDDAQFLRALAVTGGDVHIFDCMSPSLTGDDIGALQLYFYAPLSLVEQNYKVTVVESSLTPPIGNCQFNAKELPTMSLKSHQTSFLTFKFFQAASPGGTNFNRVLKSFGVITSHISDGDSCHTEIDLCSEVVKRFDVDKKETRRVSSNVIELLFGESTCQLCYPFPVAYDRIKVRLKRKEESVLIHCPRAIQDFFDEKPLFVISPDKLFPPLIVSQEAMTSLSCQQFTLQELMLIQSLGLESIERPSLLKVKKSFLKFFQEESHFYQIIQLNDKVIGLILVNNRLFNYENRTPYVDLAFCFMEEATLDTSLPPWKSISPQQLCSIRVDEDECKLLKQVFLYFAKRTNGDCSSVKDPKCRFKWLIEKQIQHYFTRAVISFLLCDVDHFNKVLEEQPNLVQELVPGVTKEKCDYCGKLSMDGSLKKCSKCKGVKYCDEKCQRAHWKTHKSVCKRAESCMPPKQEKSTPFRPFPIARFWHDGDFRYYYAYGNTPAEDFLENCTGIEEPRILSLGCGDIRSCFYTLWKHFDFSISQAPKRFQSVHFVLNDCSAPVQARNIVFLYLCLHLPSKIEERKRWLCAMWAIWYCHELHRQHQSVLDNCLRALLKYSESLDQWKQADNPLNHLVKFTSPAVLTEMSHTWKLWLERKMGVNSVKQMQTSRMKELERNDVLNDVEFYAFSYSHNVTFISGDVRCMESKESEIISYLSTGNCYAEEVLNLKLQALSTTANLTFYEKPNGIYSLHFGSMPFSGYYHTVEFSPRAMKSAGIQNSLCESMLVPSKKFKSLPFLSNSVQQFSMWIQSAHRVLGEEQNQKFSFTFDTQHALSFCQELVGMTSQFDLIYTSNLIDHLSPPNLILPAIMLLKENGLLFSSSLLYKSFTRNLDQFLTVCFGFDCKLLPVILGIRCINHEGAGYTSSVMSEPIPVHSGDMLKVTQHYKKLTFQKVSADPLVLPKLPPLENGNITDAMLDSVKVSMFSLLNGCGEGTNILNNQCTETTVLILQTFASSVKADAGNYHFWEPLSSALCHEVKMKPYLHSLQTQLLLHKLHLHLVVNEASCPLCNHTPMEKYLGMFCAEISLPIMIITPRFIAFVHRYPSSDDVSYLCKQAKSGKDVHIFDCFDGIVEGGTLKLRFFAPKKFVDNNYDVTMGLTYMMLGEHNVPNRNEIISCPPTSSLQAKQIKFADYTFFPTTSLNLSSVHSDFGKLTFHGGDGDRMRSEVSLSNAAVKALAEHRLSTSKVSSNAIKLECGKFSHLLTFKYPIDYNSLSVKFSKAHGQVTIISPRQAHDFTEEKPVSITSPDHQLSLPPHNYKHQMMIIYSQSGMQMSKEDRKILNACGGDHKLMPPLLSAKESLLFFFQRQGEAYFRFVVPPDNLRGLVVVNRWLFDYQHRAPAVDLAFYFADLPNVKAYLSSLERVQKMTKICVAEAEIGVLRKILTYFASRTNGTCRSACMPSNFKELQQLEVDDQFTRAVIYLLYGDPDECGMNMIGNVDDDIAEAFHDVMPAGNPATGPQCEYCGKCCPETKKCGRCKTVQYCSKDCQTRHWPVHKKSCKVVPVQSKTTREFDKPIQGYINRKTSITRGATMKPAVDRMKTRCSNCSSRSDRLKKCKKCGVALYCDTECQRNHWPRHKSECKSMTKACSSPQYRFSAAAEDSMP